MNKFLSENLSLVCTQRVYPWILIFDQLSRSLNKENNALYRTADQNCDVLFLTLLTASILTELFWYAATLFAIWFRQCLYSMFFSVLVYISYYSCSVIHQSILRHFITFHQITAKKYKK